MARLSQLVAKLPAVQSIKVNAAILSRSSVVGAIKTTICAKFFCSFEDGCYNRGCNFATDGYDRLQHWSIETIPTLSVFRSFVLRRHIRSLYILSSLSTQQVDVSKRYPLRTRALSISKFSLMRIIHEITLNNICSHSEAVLNFPSTGNAWSTVVCLDICDSETVCCTSGLGSEGLVENLLT